MKFVLASRNAHKIRELRDLLSEFLSDVEVLSLDDVGLVGEIEENGESFAENALIKAKAAAASGYIGLGDDSGLAVRALGGAPGIYSARFAGEHGNDAANNQKLLRELADKEDRFGEFVCVLACAFPDGGEPIIAEGRTPGVILAQEEGEGGFGYDPLFFYEPAGKTFATMTAEEKNAVSHRGRAIRVFAERFAARMAE